MDRRLLKPLLLVTVVLVLPVALLAIRGESFAAQLEAWRKNPPPPATLAALVVAVLAADVVLPVPSGPVSTLAGSHLGVLLGTAASTIGMTLGATIAFALARSIGSFKKKSSKPAGDLSVDSNSGNVSGPLQVPASATPGLRGISGSAQQACHHGPSLLIITRPLPIVAEAAVLLVAGLQMPWRIFLPAVVATNLVISGTYALLGAHAAARGWLPLAIYMSVGLPLSIAIAYRYRLRKTP
jgi:uncharacterized membrane protein YdjX (TVP38/TMEM64 family)